jgi:predicted NUDIX family NTP pyrophosphohydrolase
MSDDRTKADKAWEARQEAARYRIFNAATNAAEATDEADDETYFAVLDQESFIAIGAYQRAGGKTVTITNVVSDLTGRRPRTFSEFARDHAALFRG